MASSFKIASTSVALCNRLLKKTLVNPQLPTMGCPHRVTSSVPFCTEARALEKHKNRTSLPFGTRPRYDGSRALFDSWCEKHGRRYSCDEEKEYRFKVFQENCASINEDIAKNQPYCTSGLNTFSDKTRDELLNTYARRYVPKDAAGKVIHVHSNEEYNEHIDKSIKSKKLVVLYFIKRRCRKPMGSVVDHIAQTRFNATFLKICAIKLKALADEYAVEEVPTFVFLKGGKEVDRIVVGTEDIPDLMRKIQQHVPIIH